MADQTKGIRPLQEAPTITIEGNKYQLRRLGILDVFSFLDIIQHVMNSSPQLSQQITQATQELDKEGMIGATMFYGLSTAKDKIIEFLASLLGVEPEEYMDPEKFPLYSHAEIIEGLLDHPDIDAFFTNLQRIAKTNKIGQKIRTQFGSKSSTESKNGTDGQIKQS